MLPKYIVVALLVGLAIVLLLYVGAGTLAESRWGRVALMVGLLVLPLLLSAGSVSCGLRDSSRTEFCLSCHEMQRYGKSLFADNRAALSAVHYQNRLVDRDSTCFTCHADYAMFGDLKAKLNGLRHVWVHYFGKIPEKMALYEPYPSANCLHCHDDARRFLEAPPHKAVFDALYTGKTSCLACHSVAHDLKMVTADKLWEAK